MSSSQRTPFQDVANGQNQGDENSFCGYYHVSIYSMVLYLQILKNSGGRGIESGMPGIKMVHRLLQQVGEDLF